MRKHVVLLGDSIFDNAVYVPNGPAVVEQLSALLMPHGRATLLARDGDIASDVPEQVRRIPPDASHLVLSVGGNDALGAIPAMSQSVSTVNAAMGVMAKIRVAFQREYRTTIQCIIEHKLPLAVCTVYEDVPGLTEELKTALAIFNDTIAREALSVGATIIDLRYLCTEFDDYSERSPIEPSAHGGQKIAAAIHRWLQS
jgi:hypothetical protein